MEVYLTEDQVKSYIDTIDFTNIINKMVKFDGWLRNDALAACQMYRNFLFLKWKYGSKNYSLPPSEEIDIFWHNHILDTHKYRSDCQIIFGYYLDHYPYFGIDEKSNYQDLDEAFTAMRLIYKEEFKQDIQQIRGFVSYLYKVIYKLWSFFR